jgi:hypothetical protein
MVKVSALSFSVACLQQDHDVSIVSAGGGFTYLEASFCCNSANDWSTVQPAVSILVTSMCHGS